jgi:hypothetical protein
VDHLEHPAISAWRELQPERVEPERLEILKTENQATTIYRLTRVGQPDSTVIAKRCRQSTARIERAIYEEILPNLPLPMLHYYGFVEEPDAEFCWLFIEDVSADDKYDPHIEDHRIAAAQWLGTMNTSASSLAAIRRLPERGPEHYLDLLQSARDMILSHITNPSLNADDRALLETTVDHCVHLNLIWSQLAHVCDGMPQTLVHGDFIKKNVAVRSSRDGIILLPYDWEKAGCGIPAEDISRVDIPTYWLTVRDFWPGSSARAFKRLANAGRIFRCLVFLYWIAPSLAHESVREPMNYIKSCESWLADLIQAAEWQD